MGKHVVFVVPPAFGHVNPTLPLVEELAARGHRVSYVTGAALVPSVVRAGAEPVELGWNFENLGPLPGKLDSDRMFRAIGQLFDQAAAGFAGLVERFTADPADVVCFDSMAYIGPPLAEKLGLPCVGLVPSMAVNDHFDTAELLQVEFDQDAPAAQEFGAKLAAFSTEQALRDPLVPFGRPVADMNLVFVPRSFQLQADTFDDTFHFLGPALGSRARSADWQPPADGSPVLFISLGTHFNDRPEFFAACVEAFGDSPWHVAMAVGPAKVDNAPANFDVRPSFPQPAVLADATLFLSHTGMNSTMESLYSAVPLVSVPQMGEQAVNGGRVEELSLGVRLDTETVTADVLRKAVDEVASDPKIREAVDRYSAELRSVDAAAAGADALLEFLDTRGS